MVHNIWEILGIPPTSDIKTIKRAYAKKSASCHPEEHPEEFEKLYNAYKSALRIAELRQKEAPSSNEAKASPPIPPHHLEKEKTQEETKDNVPTDKDEELIHPVMPDKPSQPAPQDEPFQPAAPSPEQDKHPSVPPAIPSISQLVDTGMEQEMIFAAGKLIEKLQALHKNFPKSVNTSQDELDKALVQLEQLFSSFWFETAGWDPMFLKQLDQWLSSHRKTLNRAEAIVLFRAYRFQNFKSPSYPTIPYLSNIHWEVMQAALRYEKDMVSMAGMKPQSPPSSPVSNERKRTRAKLPLFLLRLAICSALLFTITRSRQPKPVMNDYYKEKILSELKQGSNYKPEPIVVLGPPSQADEKTTVTNDPNTWKYDRYGPVLRSENVPISRGSYAYYGKNQLTIVYPRNALTNTGDYTTYPVPVALMMNKVYEWGIHVSNSFLSNEETEGDVTIYTLETLGDNPLQFQTWIVPINSDNETSSLCQIGGCGYWSEVFLRCARQAGIDGRTWYDEDYNAHLVLTWENIQTIQDLAVRLTDASRQYYEYVDGFSPPLNLTIVYGPDTDQVLDQLQSLKKPEDTEDLAVISEAEQLEHCGPPPLPEADSSGLIPVTAFDSGTRWVSWVQMEKDSDEPYAFNPELSPDEAVQRIVTDLNGLDWVLSRFEITSLP